MDIKHFKELLRKKKLSSMKWFGKHRRDIGFASLIVGSLAVITIVGLLIVRDPLPAVDADVDDEPSNTVVFRHPLTGAVLDWTGGAVGPGIELPLVFGVMIENSAEAWPLAGLDQAFLVIEAPVEANIPRFIAFFSDDQDVEKIGPVRSARPYYLDWNDELDAVYGHVGGSPDALELITQYGTYDLNEFFQGEYYYRQNSTRYAPHNAYTSSERLSSAVEEIVRIYGLEDEAPTYDTWTFKDDEPSVETPVSFDLDWSDGVTYDVSWNYDAPTNAYVRDQRSAGLFIEGNNQVIANNVIVMETDVTVLDAMGRRKLTTVGEGEALVFQDGNQIIATWKKTSRIDRLHFYDEAGNEIAMNAGKTWIEVVEDLEKVTIQ
ncbi:MAG: DUF3048 domain-containing protein [Candidatus Uhrbacteria bacterium]|nr:DUF3048 domain-containing protein [Candidatus Uhrbacteria bacterium]